MGGEDKMSKNNSDFFKVKNDWSLIKDKLLGCYLMPYFQKVLATGKTICYVDCFSGKGLFEDGNPGSPIIALQTRDKCLQKTKMRIDKSKAIETTFIDLNYAADLRVNLAPYSNYYGIPNIVDGKYEEKIVDILKSKKDQNVFLYIDPYGIKALDTVLFDKFQAMGFHSFEMLINFNSFGFFRDACRVMAVDYKNDSALRDLDDLVEYDPTSVVTLDKPVDMLSNIAGGDYWKAIVQDYKEKRIDGYKAEQRLSTEYKQRLKKRYSYVLDMPIRLKAGSRPKYRMIHVCDHEDGCFLMAQNIQNRKDELYTNIQTGGQMSLFDIMPGVSQSVEGEWILREEVKQKVQDTIEKVGTDIGITRFIAAFVNDNGLICNFNLIYEILKELEQERKILIDRNPAFSERAKCPSTFMTEDKNKTVTIRRLKA